MLRASKKKSWTSCCMRRDCWRTHREECQARLAFLGRPRERNPVALAVLNEHKRRVYAIGVPAIKAANGRRLSPRLHHFCFESELAGLDPGGIVLLHDGGRIAEKRGDGFHRNP